MLGEKDLMKIRYFCHAGQGTGFAIAAERTCLALHQAGVELEVVQLGAPPDGPGPFAFTGINVQSVAYRSNTMVDVAIVQTLPGDCHKIEAGPCRKRVAYTTWEALTCPLVIQAPLYATFDEVWTPSTHSMIALTGGHQEREACTYVVPHTYDDSAPPVDRAGGYSDRVRFYWIGAWTARKNPEGVIRAFCHAFGPGDDVELVMHSPGTDPTSFVLACARTGLEQHQMPQIHFSGRRVTDQAIASMHADGDVFVSASRGEAWNLPCFDALVAGRHIITTKGLGSDEYLGEDTDAVLVDSRIDLACATATAISVEQGQASVQTLGAQGLSCRETWLEPDLFMFSTWMRRLANLHRKRVGAVTHYNIDERYGYRAVANLILERISK